MLVFEDLTEKNKQYLTEEEDYLNSKKTRNSENTYLEDYNCGGYALGTYSWYCPYERTDYFVESRFINYCEQGFSSAEIYSLFANMFKKRMKEDFGESLISLNEPEEVYNFSGAQLIAFKFLFEPCEKDFTNEHSVHFDFHYRICDPLVGIWYEKCGSNDIRELDFYENLDDDWDCGFNVYDSKTYYFALKSKGE